METAKIFSIDDDPLFADFAIGTSQISYTDQKLRGFTPLSLFAAAELMAELAARVRPCGAVGKYLYEEMEEYNLRSDEPPGLRRGENWCLGDSPVVGALLQCEWRGNFHMQAAPRIADDMRYLPNPAGKQIRVYDAVDVRFILEDMYAKLKLFSEAE